MSRPTSLRARDGSTVLIGGSGRPDDDEVGTVVARPGPPRRRRRWWIPALVVILVAGLLGAAVGIVETEGRRQAEQRIGQQIRLTLGIDTEVVATVHGTPFVTQLVQRRFDEVTATAGEGWMATPQGVMQISGLDLRLHGLQLDPDLNGGVIDSLDGELRMPWSGAADLVDADLRYAGTDDQGRGRIAISRTLDFQGLSLPLTVSGRPEIDPEQRLRLAEPQLAVSGINLPVDLVSDLLTQQLQPVELPTPPGVSVTAISAEDAGLRLQISGGRTVV